MNQAMKDKLTTRRKRSAKVLAMLAIVGLTLGACTGTEETSNLTDLNEVRASAGLSELVQVADLNIKAEAQAERMANRGTIFHSQNLAAGVGAGWSTIGENVALAGSVSEAQIALEASPSHYANMTNPAYNQVGLGVVSRNGIVYVVQVFVGR